MMPVDAEALALRDAAARGDFAAAENAAMRFTGLLQSLLAELPPAEAAGRLRQACELMEWARRHLCVARARVAGEIRRLENLRHYHAQLSAAVHTFKVEG